MDPITDQLSALNGPPSEGCEEMGFTYPLVQVDANTKKRFWIYWNLSVSILS